MVSSNDVLLDAACSPQVRAAVQAVFPGARLLLHDIGAIVDQAPIELNHFCAAVLGLRNQAGVPSVSVVERLRTVAPHIGVFVIEERSQAVDRWLPRLATSGIDEAFALDRPGDKEILQAMLVRRVALPPPEMALRALRSYWADCPVAVEAMYCVRNAYRPWHRFAPHDWFGLKARSLRTKLRNAGCPTPTFLTGFGRGLHWDESVVRGRRSRIEIATLLDFETVEQVRSERRRVRKRAAKWSEFGASSLAGAVLAASYRSARCQIRPFSVKTDRFVSKAYWWPERQRQSCAAAVNVSHVRSRGAMKKHHLRRRALVQRWWFLAGASIAVFACADEPSTSSPTTPVGAEQVSSTVPNPVTVAPAANRYSVPEPTRAKKLETMDVYSREGHLIVHLEGLGLSEQQLASARSQKLDPAIVGNVSRLIDQRIQNGTGDGARLRRLRQLFDVLQAPNAGAYHETVRRLPVRLVVSTLRDETGRLGIQKIYTHESGRMVRTFTPITESGRRDDSEENALEGEAPSSDSIDDGVAADLASVHPETLPDCEYTDDENVYYSGPCATEEDIEDATIEALSMDAEAAAVESETNAEIASYCQMHQEDIELCADQESCSASVEMDSYPLHTLENGGVHESVQQQAKAVIHG